MRTIEWPRVTRQNGLFRVAVTGKFDPAFRNALRLYAEQESQRLGRTVSQSIILETLALQNDARLRRLYQIEDAKQ